MIEALIICRMLRTLSAWQQSCKLNCQLQRINHFVFCIAWMYITPYKLYLSSSSIEIFILQFSYFSTIKSITPLTTKLSHIKMIWSFAYLLIWSKGQSNLTMLEFWMCLQKGYSLNNFCYSGLIIRTEQSSSICYN